jgi:hypothetical protein
VTIERLDMREYLIHMGIRGNDFKRNSHISDNYSYHMLHICYPDTEIFMLTSMDCHEGLYFHFPFKNCQDVHGKFHCMLGLYVIISK